MTTISMLPNNNDTSCLVSSRKRKRRAELHVRFCTQPEVIVYTYSQSDYDRSGLFPDTKKEDQQKQQFIFRLSINFVQNQQEIIDPPLFKKKSKFNNNQRPKLSIDTSNLHGPLYFTNMTTNHQKKKEIIIEEDETNAIDLVTKENTRRNSLPLVSC
ncbi:hypothetical protein BDF21DRAFT_423961 [Thamnidium elegans]|uniref:Uncharacterized protein n=1 Tax=Thamnidium elegans TaxID=101142 RepID=A0A8H7VRC8_9FUNG|nr:hypothetical protein INT48_006242 [Thamnidium elegans]KAI8073652.1 hypothetical protein BDF21DRAFT_423961 [Thamnidium elegans]